MDKYPVVVESIDDLEECWVRDLDDGGMGSIEFIADNQERRYACGSKIGVVFFDTDGVDVSAVIIVDQEGFIFELDIVNVPPA